MTAESPQIRDRQSALAFLFGRIDYERTRTVPYRSRRFKLDRMRQLAHRIGHPERAFPAVHIAGTKGKGSTAGMIATVLQAAGYRTGLYTSPHLHRLEERFVIDGAECNEQELVSLLAEVQPVVSDMDREAAADGEQEGPTYFEITTATALLHFQRRSVDCAVLEVGLGGRLDSTNICHPSVSVVTSISFDHTRQLGKTLARIAGEKAGIIKPGTPVITGVCQSEPFDVIADMARRKGCRLLALGRDFDFEYLATFPHAGRIESTQPAIRTGLHYREHVAGCALELRNVSLAMLGRHQASNAAVALATLGQLRRDGWNIDETVLRSGLAQAHCPARFEVLSCRPTVILDVAHNPASVAAMSEALHEQFPAAPRLLVFATSMDKDVTKMLGQLLPDYDHVVFTRYLNNPRSMDPVALEKRARRMIVQRGWSTVHLHSCPDPPSAWQLVQALASPQHVVCVAGSFFLAAEVREHLQASCHAAFGASVFFK